MDDLSRRIDDAGADLLALRPALVAGEPWPLSATYGTEPEADWGPREVLAHIDEMVDYWVTELTRVVSADAAAGPVEFGRVASDATRLARITAERQRPADQLLDAIAANLAAARAFVAGLGAADLTRTGAHPTRGEITVANSLDRFLASHLEEHVRQLRSILADTAAPR
jgi:DinB family protein